MEEDKATRDSRAVLHIGMNSGALFEFEGEAAHDAHDEITIQSYSEHPFAFAIAVSRKGFEQRINLALVESIDWYPQGTSANV